MTITDAPGSVLDALGVLRDRVGAVRLLADEVVHLRAGRVVHAADALEAEAA